MRVPAVGTQVLVQSPSEVKLGLKSSVARDRVCRSRDAPALTPPVPAAAAGLQRQWRRPAVSPVALQQRLSHLQPPVDDGGGVACSPRAALWGSVLRVHSRGPGGGSVQGSGDNVRMSMHGSLCHSLLALLAARATKRKIGAGGGVDCGGAVSSGPGDAAFLAQCVP